MMATTFDIKDFVRKVAPTVAAALGGPLAGGVVSGLSQIFLGRPDGSTDDIAAVAVNGNLTPSQISEIKQLEMKLKAEETERQFRYADLAYKQDQLEVDDRKDARQREIDIKDNMPQIIFFLFLGMYALEVGMFFFGQMPTDEYVRALMTRAFGTVEAGVVGAVAYFIGSSRGSKNNGDALRRIAEAPVAAPVVVTAPATVTPTDDSGMRAPAMDDPVVIRAPN